MKYQSPQLALDSLGGGKSPAPLIRPVCCSPVRQRGIRRAFEVSVLSILLVLPSAAGFAADNSPSVPSGFSPAIAPAVIQPGKSVTALFSSGEGNERGRQEFGLSLSQPGTYVLVLENANTQQSDHWLIWDSILLKRSTNNAVVWSIGRDDVGLNKDFSESAFAEFASKDVKGAAAKFVVGKTKSKDFIRELNDFDVTLAEIQFDISAEQLPAKPVLVLSTLYSSHAGAPDGFRMRLSIRRFEK